MSHNLITFITVLLGITTGVGVYFGWEARNITHELATQVLLVSFFLLVNSACVFFRKWNENQGKFVFLLGTLLSIFFVGWSATGLDMPDFAVIALRMNAVGSVIIPPVILYIISPWEKVMHDSSEMWKWCSEVLADQTGRPKRSSFGGGFAMWYVVCVVMVLVGCGLVGLYFLLAPLVKDAEAETMGINQKGEGELTS